MLFIRFLHFTVLLNFMRTFAFLFLSGGFSANQVSEGSISCLNIWSGTYSSDELLCFSKCDNHGDIFHLSPGSGEIYGSGVTFNSGHTDTDPGIEIGNESSNIGELKKLIIQFESEAISSVKNSKYI